MREEHWQEHHSFFLGYLVTGPKGAKARVALLIIFNNSTQQQEFQLPRYKTKPGEPVLCWHWLVDTNRENGVPQRPSAAHGEKLHIEERSVAILGCGKDITFKEEDTISE